MKRRLDELDMMSPEFAAQLDFAAASTLAYAACGAAYAPRIPE
jgi:hypothetical protein